MLTKQDYKNALLSQTACNSVALIRELNRACDRIMEESRVKGEGTLWRNNHPIIRLYLEQLIYLCKTEYTEASKVCETQSQEEKL